MGQREKKNVAGSVCLAITPIHIEDFIGFDSCAFISVYNDPKYLAHEDKESFPLELAENSKVVRDLSGSSELFLIELVETSTLSKYNEQQFLRLRSLY